MYSVCAEKKKQTEIDRNTVAATKYVSFANSAEMECAVAGAMV